MKELKSKNEKTNSKKSIIKLLSVLGVFIIFIIVLIAATKSKEKEDESSLNKFYEMLNSRSYGIIYLAQTTCSACESFDKVLEEVKTVGDINYVKINMDKLLNSSANEIVEKLEIEDLRTPYLAVVKEGKVVETFNYLDQGELLEKLKTYNLVDKDATLGINYLNLETFLDLFNSGKTSVIAISSIDNAYTKTTVLKDVLKEISKENKVGINYFELSFDSEDNRTTFFNTLGLTLDQEIPVVVIIQNKKVTDKLEGVVSKTEVLEFLKSNKIVK